MIFTSFDNQASFEAKNGIHEVFIALKIKQDTTKQDKLIEYANLIFKWNKTYNLTSIKKIQDIYIQHLYDSLTIIQPLEKHLNTHNIEKATVLDVGSGAGLPGVVIAIMCPYIKVVCIDSVGKKVAFIKHVAGALNLTNLSAHHQRVEQWKTEPVHIVISRAFTSLFNFTKWAGMHVQQNGYMVAMKANLSEDELYALKQQSVWQIDTVENLVVPYMNAARCLVWINKKEHHNDQ